MNPTSRPQAVRRWFTIAILAVAAVLAGYVLAPYVAPPAHRPSRVAVGLQVGDYPPNFTLSTVTGQRITLRSLKGHAVWLNFWATWCVWCKAEMPAMEQIYVQEQGRIRIVGVDVQESRSAVSAFLTAHHISYPVVLDSSGRVSTLYDVTALPKSIFIGPDGRITAVVTGSLLSAKGMEPMVRQAIQGR
jgi:cytochrome c biogenesis protein CcmG/thiol:disulfide interchange protein DsbE